MQRCSAGFFLIIILTFAVTLSGCLGKSSPNSLNGGVRSVSLNPTDKIAMDVGSSQVFTATATDANGRRIVGTVQYLVQSGNPGTPSPLSVATNGNACAGTWDAQIAICSPGTPGIALVTAVLNGVSSPPTTVYVHFKVDSIQVMPAQQQNPPFECFSQGQSWNYQAIAYSHNLDITTSVGPLNWSSTNTGVLKTASQLPNMPLNQVQITAETPGITQLFASVSGTTSNILPITTCLVQYIRLQAQGQTGSSVTVSTGSTLTLEASVVDTLGFTLTKPPLTWSTNNPEVMNFANTTSSTTSNSATVRANLGGADVTASCTPPTCNIGVLPGMPVYASGGALSPTNQQIGYGAISANVITTSKPPVYTAWAATNMCGNAPGCQSFLFSVAPGTTPIATIMTAARTPNSFLFNFQSAPRLYIGSDQGLMYSDLTGASPTITTVSPATTPCSVALCGTVLAISNDGKQVVVSDNVSPTPQVYLYSSANNTATDLVLPNVVTAAAFSPDQSKIFLLTDAGTLYVYSTVDALAPVPAVTNGTDVAFSSDSSLAFVAASSGSVGSVSAYSTCATPIAPSTLLGTISTAAPPLRIFPSPNIQADKDFVTQNVFVLAPPYVQVLTAQYTQIPIAMTQPWPAPNQLTCNPPVPPAFNLVAGTTYNLSQGTFIPLYARLAGDGSELIIVAKKNPSVLVFNVANGTTSAVPLVNHGDPLAATASTDGGQVYVAACDQYEPPPNQTTCAAGSVHIVNTVTQGDFQQVPFTNNQTNNLCNNLGGNAPLCVANVIAIKPQ